MSEKVLKSDNQALRQSGGKLTEAEGTMCAQNLGKRS